MKTAISIPDSQFQTAEALAARLGLSRSELYQRALAEFIARHSDEAITNQLDEVHGEAPVPEMDRELLHLQARSLARDEW